MPVNAVGKTDGLILFLILLFLNNSPCKKNPEISAIITNYICSGIYYDSYVLDCRYKSISVVIMTYSGGGPVYREAFRTYQTFTAKEKTY
jgi:hypothetical protein